MEIAFFLLSLSGLTSKFQKFLRFGLCLSEVYPRASIRLWTKRKEKKREGSFSSVIGPKGWKPQNLSKCILGSEPARTGSSELWAAPSHNRKWRQYLKHSTEKQKQLKMTKSFSNKISSFYVFSDMCSHTGRGTDWSSFASPIFSNGIFIFLLRRSSKCYLEEVNNILSSWKCLKWMWKLALQPKCKALNSPVFVNDCELCCKEKYSIQPRWG